MALTWDVTKIEEYKQKFPDAGTEENPQWNAVTMAIVWHGLLCGFQTITQTNYIEVFARIKAYEDAFGPSLSNHSEDKREPRPITITDIKGHIGLSTNNSIKTLNAFKKFLGENLYNEALREAKKL